MKTRLTWVLGVLSLVAMSTHAQERVAMGAQGAGSGTAAANLAQDDKIQQLQTQQNGYNAVIQKLLQQIGELQKQVSTTQLIITQVVETPGGKPLPPEVFNNDGVDSNGDVITVTNKQASGAMCGLARILGTGDWEIDHNKQPWPMYPQNIAVNVPCKGQTVFGADGYPNCPAGYNVHVVGDGVSNPSNDGGNPGTYVLNWTCVRN